MDRTRKKRKRNYVSYQTLKETAGNATPGPSTIASTDSPTKEEVEALSQSLLFSPVYPPPFCQEGEEDTPLAMATNARTPSTPPPTRSNNSPVWGDDDWGEPWRYTEDQLPGAIYYYDDDPGFPNSAHHITD